jgi:hypothetical protein
LRSLLTTLTVAGSLVVGGTNAESKSTTDRSYLINGLYCIHKYEGAWNANTGNGYFGGLQMDYGFMRAYGSEYLRRWGTANNWSPIVQINVAIRAYLSGRGWYPWPSTARMCGLI